MFKKKNQIGAFFLKLLLLLIITIILDQIIGNTLRYFYFKQLAGSLYRTTYSIDSTNDEILIFGSSRANHHYVPEIFENKLKMSFYNTGRDGNFILYNYAIFNAILKRYTPKIIILDLLPEELNYSQESYDRLESLLPYYKHHPEIRNVVKLRSPYEKIKLLSSIYPFNSKLLTIAIGNLKLNKSRKSDNKGYIPLVGKMKEPYFNHQNKSVSYLDVKKIQILESFSKLCYHKNIKLFVCFSPMYIKIDKSQNDLLIDELANKNHFKYFDFSNDSLFINNPDVFKDINHLNKNGAIQYSSLVADTLKYYLDKF